MLESTLLNKTQHSQCTRRLTVNVFADSLNLLIAHIQQIEDMVLLRAEGIIFNLRVAQTVLADNTVLTGTEYAKLIISH